MSKEVKLHQDIMKIISKSDENQMILGWLKSELFRMKNDLLPKEIALIEQADLNSDSENQTRKSLLLHKYGRSAILDKIPPIPEWYKAEIEDKDKDKLYVLPVFDWFLDTGRTFKVIDTLKHLSSKRGYQLNNQPAHQVHHYGKINDMLKNPPEDLDTIITITTSMSTGPFTVIDGTHRVSMLAKQERLVGTEVFVGANPDLSGCFWSIERADIQQHLSSLNQLVSSGRMW